MNEHTERKVYVLNSPVLTGYGDWRFEGPIAIERAKELMQGGFVSAMGHPASARFLGEQLGIEVPVHRVAIAMQPGDQAIVLRLKGRLPEGAVLTEEQMRALPFELGLLTRVS
jgi:hypothetical protein